MVLLSAALIPITPETQESQGSPLQPLFSSEDRCTEDSASRPTYPLSLLLRVNLFQSPPGSPQWQVSMLAPSSVTSYLWLP